MTRIERILQSVRDVLADQEEQRWTDARLLRLLDKAHKDIATRTKLLKGTYELFPRHSEALQTLPDYVWLVIRAKYNGLPLDIKSFDDMDLEYNYAVEWETEVGTPTTLVFDNRNLNEIRLFPIPDETTQDITYTITAGVTTSQVLYAMSQPHGIVTTVAEFETLLNDFGIVTSSDSVFYDNTGVVETLAVDMSSVYGITAAILDDIAVLEQGAEDFGIVSSITDYASSSAFGVTTSFDDAEVIDDIDTPFGLVTAVYETTVPVIIQYVKAPDTILTMQDELLTHPMFDTAIEHHIVGHAFRDDQDTRSVAKAAEALGLYEVALKPAKQTSARDGTKTIRTSQYRSGLDR